MRSTVLGSCVHEVLTFTGEFDPGYVLSHYVVASTAQEARM